MSESQLREALAHIKASDFHVDDAGRVVVSNPSVSRALAEAIGGPSSALRDNGNCNCLTRESVGKIIADLQGRSLDNANCNCLPQAE
jgi:hypothetical protein